MTNQKPEKLGWGLIYGIFPCWIIPEADAEPCPYGPTLMFGFIEELLLSFVGFLYYILTVIFNIFVEDEESAIEPMFVIWLSPKTKKTLKEKYGDVE